MTFLNNDASTEGQTHSEKCLKIIFECAPDAYYLIDLNGVIVDGNKSAEEMIGYSRDELIGKKIFEVNILPPKQLPRATELLNLNALEKPTGPEEFTLIRKDGKQVYVELRTYPVKIDGGTLVLGIAKDITERKKLEAQLLQAQKMEAVGRLAGGVAHDFNNILSAIINYSYLLKDEVKKDSLKDMIDKILSLSDKASNITRGLLAFSRKQYVEPKPVNLNNVIKDIGKLLSNFIGEDIEFTLILSGSELMILADVTHLEQCIMNLATNARDAMPNGGSLTIETEVLEVDTDFINSHGFGVPGLYSILSVTDTGTGMDDKTRQKIFDPFYSSKEVGKGTGLGLAIVYGIIKQHKGYIDVYSEPRKGTTFRLYLPIIEAYAETENEKPPPGITGNMETILVVEDEAAVRGSICKILEKFYYRVIQAVDGVDAVAKFRKQKDEIRLVILDVIMPKKNGKETYEEIKQITSGIKAIFISGYTADMIHSNKMLEKRVIFVSKPILPNDLLLKIKELLENEREN